MADLDEPSPIWPRPLRARARRCRSGLLALRRDLLALCPNALAIARDPSLCERIETTAHDHLAADVLLATKRLLDALEDID